MAWEYPAGLSGEERIKQNIKNILETAKGDVPYERDLGINADWIDKPEGGYDAEILTEMMDQCNKYEERVATTIELENGTLKVTCENE